MDGSKKNESQWKYWIWMYGSDKKLAECGGVCIASIILMNKGERKREKWRKMDILNPLKAFWRVLISSSVLCYFLLLFLHLFVHISFILFPFAFSSHTPSFPQTNTFFFSFYFVPYFHRSSTHILICGDFFRRFFFLLIFSSFSHLYILWFLSF